MAALALGIASAGLSLLGGMAQNSAITANAKAQREADILWNRRDFEVGNANIQRQQVQLGQQVGAELSNLGMQLNQAIGQQTAVRAETQAYGNLAARQQAVAETKAALAADNIIQKGEAAEEDLMVAFLNNKYKAEQANANSSQQQANLLSQRQSSLSLIGGAVASGIGTASAAGYKFG